MILEQWLSELEARNRDNIARTESYLELYEWTRNHREELPWLLMAHLVSRNAGYLMSDIAHHLEGKAGADPALAAVMRTVFVLLERANWLIFHDAWHHVLHYLMGRNGELSSPRTPRFVIEAYARHAAAPCERRLALDLVHNEQNLIERRAVHHPELIAGTGMIELMESSGREAPLHLPVEGAPAITVGRFANLHRRIETGRRIFDEVLAERDKREALFLWAKANPHTGSRAVYGGAPGPTVREAWPVDRVRSLWARVHAPMEEDPRYP